MREMKADFKSGYGNSDKQAFMISLDDNIPLFNAIATQSACATFVELKINNRQNEIDTQILDISAFKSEWRKLEMVFEATGKYYGYETQITPKEFCHSNDQMSIDKSIRLQYEDISRLQKSGLISPEQKNIWLRTGTLDNTQPSRYEDGAAVDISDEHIKYTAEKINELARSGKTMQEIYERAELLVTGFSHESLKELMDYQFETTPLAQIKVKDVGRFKYIENPELKCLSGLQSFEKKNQKYYNYLEARMLEKKSEYLAKERGIIGLSRLVKDDMISEPKLFHDVQFINENPNIYKARLKNDSSYFVINEEKSIKCRLNNNLMFLNRGMPYDLFKSRMNLLMKNYEMDKKTIKRMAFEKPKKERRRKRKRNKIKHNELER